MEMTPPVAQATPVALGAPVMAQPAPVGGAQPAFEVRTGCGPLRCMHITVMVFGIINLVLGILSIFTANWIGLLMGLAMGALGITAASLMNPCGCCTDPVPGTCECCNPAGTKCIAAVNIVNCVVHIVQMILIIVLMVMIGEACDVTSKDNQCLGFGQAIVAVLGAFLGWYTISLIICVVAAVYAFKATGGGQTPPAGVYQ